MPVIKVLELVGESPSGWTDAVENAVHTASESVDDITGVEVTNFTARVDDGHVEQYRANVKVAFAVTPERQRAAATRDRARARF